MLHFATIITPDADPVKRRGMLDVLEHYFADKNASPLGATPPLHTSRKMMFMVNRRWELHVWELHRAPETWHEQLKAYLAQQPVFAVLSGTRWQELGAGSRLLRAGSGAVPLSQRRRAGRNGTATFTRCISRRVSCSRRD
ncbi:hypothetical protein OKW41_004794 [Paraburkholderia sp. UCT70]